MSHEATTLPAQPPLRSLPMPERRLSAAEQEPPLWTATRIDVARRLWCKGVAEDDIVAALNRLAGASHGNPQALIALARRLCWPRPQQSLGMLRLTTRDGSPSLAERQAVDLAFVNDVVELPMADAAAWGRANGVVRGTNEPELAAAAAHQQGAGAMVAAAIPHHPRHHGKPGVAPRAGGAAPAGAQEAVTPPPGVTAAAPASSAPPPPSRAG